MSNLRFKSVEAAVSRKNASLKVETKKATDIYGKNVFFNCEDERLSS